MTHRLDPRGPSEQLPGRFESRRGQLHTRRGRVGNESPIWPAQAGKRHPLAADRSFAAETIENAHRDSVLPVLTEFNSAVIED